MFGVDLLFLGFLRFFLTTLRIDVTLRTRASAVPEGNVRLSLASGREVFEFCAFRFSMSVREDHLSLPSRENFRLSFTNDDYALGRREDYAPFRFREVKREFLVARGPALSFSERRGILVVRSLSIALIVNCNDRGNCRVETVNVGQDAFIVCPGLSSTESTNELCLVDDRRFTVCVSLDRRVKVELLLLT